MRNMRQNILRKEDRKEERRYKREKAKNEDDGIRRNADGETLCPVPLVQCSRNGQPLPQSLTEGIRLCCTNPDCLYVNHLVHPECFKSLEAGLLTILGNQGSARGWTVGHRKNNLWTKKGLTLVQRSLRCACGKGLVKRDDEAWKEREQLLEPPKDNKNQPKKHKSKDLPTLAFAKKGIPPPLDLKKAQELDNHFLSAHSPPPSEVAIEERYGPPKARQPRSRRTTTTSIASSTGTSKSKPSVKIPIGLAPVNSPKKEPKIIKQEPPQPTITVVASKPKVDLAKPAQNPWTQRNRFPSESLSLPPAQEELIHTNTSNSPPLTSHKYSPEDVIFEKFNADDTWFKTDSPTRIIDDGWDSGIHSSVASPKESYQHHTFVRPLSPVDSINQCFGEDRLITPPPGFGFALPRRKFPITSDQYQPEPPIDKSRPLSLPPTPINKKFYCLFDGPSFGLGERLTEILHDGTVDDYLQENEQNMDEAYYSCFI